MNGSLTHDPRAPEQSRATRSSNGATPPRAPPIRPGTTPPQAPHTSHTWVGMRLFYHYCDNRKRGVPAGDPGPEGRRPGVQGRHLPGRAPLLPDVTPMRPSVVTRVTDTDPRPVAPDLKRGGQRDLGDGAEEPGAEQGRCAGRSRAHPMPNRPLWLPYIHCPSGATAGTAASPSDVTQGPGTAGPSPLHRRAVTTGSPHSVRPVRVRRVTGYRRKVRNALHERSSRPYSGACGGPGRRRPPVSAPGHSRGPRPAVEDRPGRRPENRAAGRAGYRRDHPPSASALAARSPACGPACSRTFSWASSRTFSCDFSPVR